MRVRELLALILSLVMAGTAVAQDPVTVASAGGMTIEDLRVTVNKSLVIDYPADISRISTSNPEVVDAVPATSREFLLHGKGHGAATVVVWAKNGLRTMYNVTVEHNLDPIKRLLKDTFPSENIGLVAGRDSITLIGTVSSKDVADRAMAIATPLAKTVVSNLSLTAAPVSKQILLKVRFAELDRTAAQQFGVNLVSTGAGNTTGAISTQQFSGAQVSTDNKLSISDALNVFAIRQDLNLAAFVRALQAQGMLQILAEPNLVTTNGKEASFLVGGEFPVPVLQGGSNAGAVTIQFREFGIRLLFTPLITENQTIKLYVKPEVSTIDLANAVTFSGFTIPALATRRMETNIELGLGQSFVIAGLIDDRVTEQFNKLPGLSNIPILGALFRSRTENRSKSELVIIVTPEVATPINAGDPKPEPAWLRPFMTQKMPGDSVGSDLVPGTGGSKVAPLAPGRVQIGPESVGNGAGAHPRTPGPKADVGGPKSAPKNDQNAVKSNKLKFWGKKAPKAGDSQAFEFKPVGERPLVPPVEATTQSAPASAEASTPANPSTTLLETLPAPSTATTQAPAPDPSQIAAPPPQVAVPQVPLPPAPRVDEPLPAEPERKVAEAQTGNPLPGPASTVPPPSAVPPRATVPLQATVPSAESLAPESKPVDAQKSGEAKPIARSDNPRPNLAQRVGSAGITSLPLHMLTGSATAESSTIARPTGTPRGEQH